MGHLKGIRVKPRSINVIRDVALATRAMCNEDDPFFDIIRVLEDVLTPVGLLLDVVDDADLGDEEARTYPDSSVICVRESVYNGAVKGVGRDRFTLCHELGHLFMHDDVPHSRVMENQNHKIYEDSEWQADTFAAEVMMPLDQFNQYFFEGADSISDVFGVSQSAVNTRISVLSGRKEIKRRI